MEITIWVRGKADMCEVQKTNGGNDDFVNCY